MVTRQDKIYFSDRILSHGSLSSFSSLRPKSYCTTLLYKYEFNVLLLFYILCVQVDEQSWCFEYVIINKLWIFQIYFSMDNGVIWSLVQFFQIVLWYHEYVHFWSSTHHTHISDKLISEDSIFQDLLLH